MTNLDDAYANGAYIAKAETFPPRWTTAAQAFRDGLGDRADLDRPYGPGARMVYDHFRPAGQAKGTFVFVHGGYWRAFDKSSWSHLAQGALAHGWAVAMPSYDLCPTVPIAMITQQIALAMTTIAAEDTGPLVLAGHSAGGHLVSRMLAPGMLAEDIRGRIRHVMPISPVSDLLPLIQTQMNDDFRLDAALARAESPVLQPRPVCPVTVWVGAAERPAFVEQAQALASAWDCASEIEAGLHHFNVIDGLADPESDMTRRLLAEPL